MSISPPPKTYFAGYFSGNIQVDNDGNLNFDEVEFKLGEKSMKNIPLLIENFPKDKKSKKIDIGKPGDNRHDNVDVFTSSGKSSGGKSIKKRGGKNRKTKKNRRNRK